jgi:hypothetical protein
VVFSTFRSTLRAENSGLSWLAPTTSGNHIPRSFRLENFWLTLQQNRSHSHYPEETATARIKVAARESD